MKSNSEFLPFSEQPLSDKLQEEPSPYFIYRMNQQNLYSNSKFFDWYTRLRIFLVFFINIASSVDNNDSNWIAYILYQQYENDNGNICYAPIGSTTVYLHHAYPDKKRPRIGLESIAFLFSFISRFFYFLVKC